jgi:orotidine-5'-phosphate decarboxylase
VLTANPLIVALDADDPEVLLGWADALGGIVGHLKVGLQAFVARGPALVNEVAARAPVFLDLKLHDIPATVAGAAAAADALGAAMLTVHAGGGAAMVRAAVEAAPSTAILAVTVLTSLDDAALAAVGQPGADEQVPRLAALAVEAGAAGIVCAAPEVAAVRAAVGPEALVVVPGIRPASAALDDQARTATPAAALAAGASHLVVGRPITRAADVAAAATALLDELPRT